MERMIISLIFAALSGAVLTCCSLKPLQVMQLSSYQVGGYKRWYKRTKFDFFIRGFGLGFFSFVAMFMYAMAVKNRVVSYFGFGFFVGLGVFFVVTQQRVKQKTPLKFTPRIIRLLAMLAIIYCGLSFLAVYFTLYTAVEYTLIAILPLLIPLIVAAAHFAILPIERLIANRYKLKAKKALKARPELIKIGITGSFGKTTAKNILKTLLSEKFKVLASPASHNTPMGLCKLINDQNGEYDVLIAEMGARYTGDIAELCRLIEPDYGIITGTGAQHLETFGSLENIVKTKMELAAGTNKKTIVNSDDARLFEAAKSMENAEFLHSGTRGRDAAFGSVAVSPEGTSFDLELAAWKGKTGTKRVRITTNLLGRHIPALFAQCALLAFALGVSAEQIIAAAGKIEQVQHRLQLIKTENGAVIDDAYNSNPEGAKNALEVLALFKGDRVVITPGFVELGSEQLSHNLELGRRVATSADYLIAVKNPDIFGGAVSAGMPSDRIFNAESLDDAMKVLGNLNLKKLTVLFLNDLPDIY